MFNSHDVRLPTLKPCLFMTHDHEGRSKQTAILEKLTALYAASNTSCYGHT